MANNYATESAARARKALVMNCRREKQDPGLALASMLCDLMHLCTEEGDPWGDFDEALATAREYFAEEGRGRASEGR